MIVIEANITFKDILHYTFRQFYSNTGRLILQAFIFMAVAVWLYGEITYNVLDTRIGMVAFMGVIYFYLILPIRLYFNARKIYRSNKEFHHPIHYTFDQEFIKTASISHVHTHKWEVIYKIKETKDWFLIYFSQSTAALIPKNAFSIEQQKAFREMVASRKEIKQSLIK